MIPSSLNDLDAARVFWEMARLAKEPAIQRLSKQIKAAKERKPEWGRPIDEYIHDVVSPDYDSPVPPKSLIQSAIDSVQLPSKRKLSRPTYETFRVILGLFRDPANMPMLNDTKVLSACILLMREHVKDTQEPVSPFVSFDTLTGYSIMHRYFATNTDSGASKSWCSRSKSPC
ncbi:hypothetical protein FS749_008476 [Ceratobasidium sp. UAMH 11750]|nr:hypothetical protein FS749_008476 [Ceratobasidium sp. UAMH 11750]